MKLRVNLMLLCALCLPLVVGCNANSKISQQYTTIHSQVDDVHSRLVVAKTAMSAVSASLKTSAAAQPSTPDGAASKENMLRDAGLMDQGVADVEYAIAWVEYAEAWLDAIKPFFSPPTFPTTLPSASTKPAK